MVKSVLSVPLMCPDTAHFLTPSDNGDSQRHQMATLHDNECLTSSHDIPSDNIHEPDQVVGIQGDVLACPGRLQ